MKKSMALIAVLILFSSCMTIQRENRSESLSELQRLRKISIIRVPQENIIGPVFRINSPSINFGLMLAGQLGVELGYDYFVVIENQLNQFVQGFWYQGTGGVTTTSTHSFTVAYTNDPNHNPRYISSEAATTLDGHTFVTQSGRAAFWTLFGASFVTGTSLMLSALAVDFDDPNHDDKFDRRFASGIVLMTGSLLFTIPLW
jgi:hypothetical protein